MTANGNLTDLRKCLERRFDCIQQKGSSASAFLHIAHNGRGVEISDHDGCFWMEFWEKSEDEDAAPVKEITVHEPRQVLRETVVWLA